MMDKEKIYKNTKNSMQLLVANVMAMQEIPSMEWCRKTYSREALLKEICTAQWIGPRRCGHSQSAAEIAVQFERPLLIAPYKTQTDILEKRVKELDPGKRVVAAAYKREIDLFAQVTGMVFDFVVVDCARIMQPSQINSLYKVLAECTDEKVCILMVG